MEAQFEYITSLAKKYHSYSEQPGVLYKATNDLPADTIAEIFRDYGDPEHDFRPVNLLRAEVARRIMHGEVATEELVELIKEKIRAKDVTFFKEYKDELLSELREYELFKRDLFANWQDPWHIFHSFFYRRTVKETVRNYLEQICQDLISQLQLEDHTYHWVDFQGVSNFGSDFSWLAIFPDHKSSHQAAYQFFLRLGNISEAGRAAGSKIKNPESNLLQQVDNNHQAVSYLWDIKPQILTLNNITRNYFKFAPGPQARDWDEFHKAGIAALNFHELNLGDLSRYTLIWRKLKAGLTKFPQFAIVARPVACAWICYLRVENQPETSIGPRNPW
jgi:5-methylcytosine-specific restriction protein B